MEFLMKEKRPIEMQVDPLVGSLQQVADMENALKGGQIIPSRCSLRRLEEEIVNHLFVNCLFVE